MLNKKLNRLLVKAEKVHKVDFTHYEITTDCGNFVELKVTVDQNFDTCLNVYINERGWYTGVKMTPEFKDLLRRAENQAYYDLEDFHASRKRECRNFWEAL